MTLRCERINVRIVRRSLRLSALSPSTSTWHLDNSASTTARRFFKCRSTRLLISFISGQKILAEVLNNIGKQQFVELFKIVLIAVEIIQRLYLPVKRAVFVHDRLVVNPPDCELDSRPIHVFAGVIFLIVEHAPQHRENQPVMPPDPVPVGADEILHSLPAFSDLLL